MTNVVSRSEAYKDFIEDVRRMSISTATEVDIQISSEEFDEALTIAQSDADSFWGRTTTLNQALALLMTHASEIIATTKGNHVVMVSEDGYLAKQR